MKLFCWVVEAIGDLLSKAEDVAMAASFGSEAR